MAKRKRNQCKKAKITYKNKRKRCEHNEEDSREWGNLPVDLIMKILEGMDREELLMSQHEVCPLWRKACWDILFWNGQKDTLDLGALALSDLFGKASRLMWFLQSIFFHKYEEEEVESDNASKDITCMVLPPDLNLCDMHLAFLAHRSRRLKSLTLPCMKNITGKGFSRAIRNWREIEEMSIGPVYSRYYTRIIPEMVISCKKLKILCINGSKSHTFSFGNFYFDEYKSLVIAKNLCGLKVLALNYSFIYKCGVKNILSKCKQLLELNITHCKRVVLTPPSPFEYISIIPLSWKIKKMTVGTHNKWSIDAQAEMCSLRHVINKMWE